MQTWTEVAWSAVAHNINLKNNKLCVRLQFQTQIQTQKVEWRFRPFLNDRNNHAHKFIASETRTDISQISVRPHNLAAKCGNTDWQYIHWQTDDKTVLQMAKNLQ